MSDKVKIMFDTTIRLRFPDALTGWRFGDAMPCVGYEASSPADALSFLTVVMENHDLVAAMVGALEAAGWACVAPEVSDG